MTHNPVRRRRVRRLKKLLYRVGNPGFTPLIVVALFLLTTYTGGVAVGASASVNESVDVEDVDENLTAAETELARNLSQEPVAKDVVWIVNLSMDTAREGMDWGHQSPKKADDFANLSKLAGLAVIGLHMMGLIVRVRR
jgi:hypothetical protein